MRIALFIIVMALLTTGAVTVTLLYLAKARRAKNTSWQELMRRFVRVDTQNLAIVALDLIQEDGSVRDREWPELNADQIWGLVGGMDGLENIEANCQVLIDIAVYVQMTFPEALIVAEELRRNTRHIQWHVSRLRAGERNGNLSTSFAAYAQRAVASYYLMGRQLILLCERTEFAGLDQLRAAV